MQQDPRPSPASASARATSRVLVLLAHPDLRHSRVNRRLLSACESARAPLLERGVTLDLRDLYTLYPDYAIDVATEQAAAGRADWIVWMHPIQWYAMPALMKLWLDEVLTVGWAYGRRGGEGRALEGKDLWLVASTGASEASYHPGGYNRHFFDAFLPPYEQTAALCGMRFLPPLVLHGARAATAAELDDHVRVFADRLLTHPHWPELADLATCDACDVPDTDRPAPRQEVDRAS
jgi:glutathione-regulated potassium-efflux system ancillary protein KefF